MLSPDAEISMIGVNMMTRISNFGVWRLNVNLLAVIFQ
jgi:hypothetical protein